MGRSDELRRLDKNTRNKLRAILSAGDVNAISRLSQLRGTLGKAQSEAFDVILNGSRHEKAVRKPAPFPKTPPFIDTVQPYRDIDLNEMLNVLETGAATHKVRLLRVADELGKIDAAYARGDIQSCRTLIVHAIEHNGWSHAMLRRIVLIRENQPDGSEDNKIEELVQRADLNAVVVATLVHAYSPEQNFLTIKRSILNIADRGSINRYSRTIARVPVLPFARSREDLCNMLLEVEKCSLIDAIILAKFNAHLFVVGDYQAISEVAQSLGKQELFDSLIATFDNSDKESEYTFFKQSSAWLEYEPVRQYRILLDNFFDASREEIDDIPDNLTDPLHAWVGDASLAELVGTSQFTKHAYHSLAKLELAGFATRSATFNFWLYKSQGEMGFQKNDLLTLMGLTRDLARTVPIKATRTAAKLTQDQLVRLILLLLLAKRSKNELDSFNLRKLLEDIAFKEHGGSLVELVRSYEIAHPYVAEYIYEIATEDFLAKLNKLAPHRADIPEIRASLHEWMADFRNDEHYRQRARAVRIDHQLNRVRNEIDDHRIYVDPSRFQSWLEDEMMFELNSALTITGTSTGKKGVAVSCDETLISLVMKQSYNAFCSNAVFGIASYIGRRIRHGTFHGHLYSSVINPLERNLRYQPLFQTPEFAERWNVWKGRYSGAIDNIIKDRLHIKSKAKPLGLLEPENYGPQKLEILGAAVKNISTTYVETMSVTGLEQTITDYCWRLAENDLLTVTRYLRAQQNPLKGHDFLKGEVAPSASPQDARLADAFHRELEQSIDSKLVAMFGWFKRPTIVAPKAKVSLLFDAVVAEVKDTIPDFRLEPDDSGGDIGEVVGAVYHLVYDSLAVVVANAAKYGDPLRPPRRNFEETQGKNKRLIVEITSSIKPGEDPKDVSAAIERRKSANFDDANTYQGKSGIPKLQLLAHERNDFWLEGYEVVGNEVKVRLAYALEH